MIVYDDVEVTEKVKVYDKGVVVSDDPNGFYKLLVDYRSGDLWAPHLDNTEALQREAALFVQCVEKGFPSPSDGKAGLRIVNILQAASQSMEQKGRPIELEWEKLGL